jgi:branched-chain amino acid aminotransferase
MNSPVAYLNGRFLPFSEATLSFADAGFTFGATVVENVRTYRHKLFRWPEHLTRFRSGCKECFIPLEADEEEITAAAEEIVSNNAKLLPPGGDLQVVIFATPGPLGFYSSEEQNGPPTIGMHTYPLPFARYRPFFTEGVKLSIVGYHLADPESILSPGPKHRSRMAWWRAEQLAKQKGAVALLTHGPTGTITETAFANFLCVIDGIVEAPPDDQVLDGISLGETIELCLELGHDVIDRPIPAIRISEMSEAMLTGTAFGIAGVQSIDGHRFDWPGPVFSELLKAWSDLVGIDVAKQFLESA